MCYIVTHLPPIKSAGLNLQELSFEFELREAACSYAEELLLSGSTKVQVWKFETSAKIEPKVVWE
jgi:hypothetical protein